MSEIQKLESRLVRFLASLERDATYLPPTIILGSEIAIIMCSATRLFGGAMFALLGRRGKMDSAGRLTPRLKAAAESALASLHHPGANLEEDGVIALALRELFECVTSEYPSMARYAIKDFLRMQYDEDVRLFHVCLTDRCHEEAPKHYCEYHNRKMDEEDKAMDASLTPEEWTQIGEEVEELAQEREEFEDSIRRRFSKRRVD